MKKKDDKNKNLKKTLIFTILFSMLVIIIASLIQLDGQSKISISCSYLDPWIIDMFAFITAIFLIVEGFARIYMNSSDSLKKQLTRIIRIGFGFSIFTLHIIQFLHK